MDAKKKYKATNKKISIECIEHTEYYYNMVMKTKDKKPKHVADHSAQFVEFFDINDKHAGSSNSIYAASSFPNKIYKVNLRGKLTWDQYYSKLKEIQPDINIIDVFMTTQKRYESQDKFFNVSALSPIELMLLRKRTSNETHKK